MLSVKISAFATSKALNDAAKAVRETIVEKTYPQSFEPKSKGFAKAAFAPLQTKENQKHGFLTDLKRII